MLTISYNVEFDWYNVTGTVIDSEGVKATVGFGTSSKDKALKEFNYYSSNNGFKCKKVNLL